MNKNKRYVIGFILLILTSLIMFYINVTSGSVEIGSVHFFRYIAGIRPDNEQTIILQRLRFPRAYGAILVGGALALSGYLMQTFFNNPIVGPFVLGISSGAKLTVAIAMVFLLSAGINVSASFMVIAAFAGSLMAMGFVLLISARVKNMSILVVCGIMIGYICSAITEFIVTFADDSNIVNLHYWSLGTLSGVNINNDVVMLTTVALCLIVTIAMIKPIGAYRLGENYARNLGVNIKLLRFGMIMVSSLLAACVTAFTGPVSFVGIAIPHLMKRLMKTTKPAVMIPACFIAGAALTLMFDAIARVLFAPVELSISSVASVFLAPVVVYVMINKRNNKE